jgi:hypothetical protein
VDFTRTNIEEAPRAARSRLHLPSVALGAVLALAPVGFVGTAAALDLGGLGELGKTVTTSVKSLLSIKKNLDGDVKALTGDAKVLLGDKDNLLEIKDQLMTLAKQTREQIDSITKLVAEVEGHLKTTQGNIQTTAGHVGEIDAVRKSLIGGGGKK